MARRKRFHLPNATYHIMLKGNDGQAIFFSEADRVRMCLLIQEGLERFGHSVHAFCFMTNHIHLAIQVAQTSISQIMQHLAFRYTRYINWKQKRVGHLFQGRFKSILVDSELYLKELVRYIHLNPVRSGMVLKPDEYHWSSHRAYLHQLEYSWLTLHRLLRCFGESTRENLIKYEKYTLEGIGVEPEFNFKSGDSEGMIGSKEFIADVLEKVVGAPKRKIELPELVTKVCERYGLQVNDLCMPGRQPKQSHARAVLALLVRQSESLSIENLAKFLKREASGLSKLAIRLERKSQLDADLARDVHEMRQGF